MNKILLLVLALIVSIGIQAQTDLIISEYVEGWSTNKAIEIYNPTNAAINLKNYQLVRYANGEDVPPAADDWKVVLPDVMLEPYKTYVCVGDKRDPNGTGQEAPIWEQLQDRADVFLCPNYAISNTLYHNGDDAIALEKTDGTLVDIFGRWGSPRPAEALIGGSESRARCWTNTAPYFTGVGIGITADHTLFRRSNIKNGLVVNPDMFNPLGEWDSLSANTFSNLGWHKCDIAPANATPVFEKESYTFSVSKQAKEGDVVGTLKANDAENNALKYFVNSGNFIYNDSGTEDKSDDIRLVPFKLNKNSGEITLANATSLQFSKNDSVYMKVSVNDGYSESKWITIDVLLVDGPVGVNELKESNLRIYPNPLSGDKMLITGNKTMTKLAIMNVSGQIIDLFAATSNKETLTLPTLVKGIYLIGISFDDNSYEMHRFVKL